MYDNGKILIKSEHGKKEKKINTQDNNGMPSENTCLSVCDRDRGPLVACVATII